MLKHILWLILILLPNSAQEEVQLQIRLRHSDGTAAAGETITLERLPALRQAQGDTLPQAQGDTLPQAQGDTLPQAQDDALRQAQDSACTTDTYGICAWSVTPGLYQLLFTRPLDDLSALALAEGGLNGFGLTVGDDDITYPFTIHSDGHIYFDAAPDAALPSPIIPEPEDIHRWPGPTPAMTAPSTPPVEATTIASVGLTTTQGGITDRAWRPVFSLLLGAGLGGGLYLLRPRLGRVWSSKRPKTADKRSSHSPSEEKDA